MMGRMPRNRAAINPLDTPVVIDEDGRQLDGRSRGRVDPEHPFVAAAVASGRLILVADADEPPPPAGQPTADDLADTPEPAAAPQPRSPSTARKGHA